MRGILINPDDRTIMDVEYDGDYKQIYKLIGASPFDVRQIKEGESLFFDDEFLLKIEEGDTKNYFIIEGLADPVGGCALILGVDGKGDSVSTKLEVEDVKVEWQTLQLKGWEPTRSFEDIHPVLGKVTHIVGPRPIFNKFEYNPNGRKLEKIDEDSKNKDQIMRRLFSGS